MRKISTTKQGRKTAAKETTKDVQELVTIGVDVGDKTSRYCVLNGTGEVKAEGSVPTNKDGIVKMFGALRRCRIAIEVGPHSP